LLPHVELFQQVIIYTIVDPFCIIGDIGTTHKTYTNIKKLLDFVGIKYELQGTNSKENIIWNQFLEISEK
jgi:hypothetical protein